MHRKTTCVALISGLASLFSAEQAWAAQPISEQSILLLLVIGIGAAVGVKAFFEWNK